MSTPRCNSGYQHWSVSHLPERPHAPWRHLPIDKSYRALAAGSDSASYARRISTKSSPPRPAVTSGWNRFAMDRYAALISPAVAVSRTLSTSYRLLALLSAVSGVPSAAAKATTDLGRTEMQTGGGSTAKFRPPDIAIFAALLPWRRGDGGRVGVGLQ